MRVYLIRHGKAERRSESGRDEDRPLASRGERQARWMGERLAGEEARPERVLTSPAARTLATAELVCGALGLEPEIEEALSLRSNPSALVEMIAGLERSGPVVLVGHNPTLSMVAGVLVRGVGGAGALELRTGQAAVLDVPDDGECIGRSALHGLLRSDD